VSHMVDFRKCLETIKQSGLTLNLKKCKWAQSQVLFCDVDTRGFAADGPGLWNWVPSQAKEADLSYNRFRRLLKTFLLG